MRWLLAVTLLILPGLGQVHAQEKSAEELLKQAETASQADKLDKALSLCDQAVTLDPKNADAYQTRGTIRFMLGKIPESITDFDKYLELKPGRKAGHWQHGISYYYAGRFAEGRRQFEGYQKVDSNDVENAVWCLMCQAKTDGLAKARADVLKIGKDQRVPMMEVYDLFLGKIKPDDVLAAAKMKKTVRDQDDPLFYAHLYLGLYYETVADGKRAYEHLNKATEDHRHPHYMWHVARVHRNLLRQAMEKKAE